MPLPLIIPLLLQLAGGVMNAKKDEENAAKTEEYARKKQKEQEAQDKRDYLANRMMNMGRIMGYDVKDQKGRPASGTEIPHIENSSIGSILSSLGEAGMGLYGAQTTGAPNLLDKQKMPGSMQNPVESNGVPSPGLWNKPTGVRQNKTSDYDFFYDYPNIS